MTAMFTKCLILTCALFLLSLPASAQDIQKQALKIYGQTFSVTPFQMDGTTITFDNIKSYIKVIYPDIGTRQMTSKQVETFLISRNIFYSRLYESSLKDAVDKIVKYVPKSDIRKLQTQNEDEVEFPDFVMQDLAITIAQGQWQRAVTKYKPYDASLEPQLFSLQKLKYSQLAAAYLSGLVSTSDEINALYE